MKLTEVYYRFRQARKLALLRESGAPLVGPYYWLPTPHGWDVQGYPEEVYGDLLHEQAWRRYAVRLLQDHWLLSEGDTLALARYPYGVPRGRVSQGVGAYYLNHGGDAPSQLVANRPATHADAMRAVIREMNLGGLRAAKKLRILKDPHEVQLEQHTLAVSRILETSRTRTAVPV